MSSTTPGSSPYSSSQHSQDSGQFTQYPPSAGVAAMSQSQQIPDALAPLYGCGLGQAISRFFARYVSFRGAASQSEFNWMFLVVIIINMVIGIPLRISIYAGVTPADPGPRVTSTGLILIAISAIFVVVFVLPWFALTIRRLHDGGYSGWVSLLYLIPIIGHFILLFLLVFGRSNSAKWRPEWFTA